MAGKTQSQSSTSARRRQLKISYVETPEDKVEGERTKSSSRKERRSSRRVHPDAPGKKMEGKPALRVDTYVGDETRDLSVPTSTRGSQDLRSPGVQKTPIAEVSKQTAPAPLPDFITQTDANGNATTPRSAEGARNGQQKGSSGARMQTSKSRKSPGGGGGAGNGGGDDDKGAELSMTDPCDTLLDNLRMMCCWCTSDAATPKLLSTGTQDTVIESQVKLLGPHHPEDSGKPCLVLDLDETLVHSSFRAVPGADFVIPVQIEEVVHFVYVMKRPGVDKFLTEMAKHYEIVIYTASLNKYADPLLDLLDPNKVIRYRLFRESCVFYEGNYIKDLSLLNRDLQQTIIIDNSPNSYLFHPENAIDCSSFIDDPKDRELDQIGEFLVSIKDVKDVMGVAPQWRTWPLSGEYSANPALQ